VTDLTRQAPPNGHVEAAADRLLTAVATGTPCPPVRDLIGRADVETAYAVQRLLTERRLAGGATVVGRKIGLTAPAVQAQLGVDQPDFGVLFDDMSRAEGQVDIGGLLQPRIEAEVAFVLGSDLDDPDGNVRAAVEYAVAALEIVDSRIAGWDISFADTVADNASSGLFVLGSRPLPLDAVEPRDVEMTMTMDGAPASAGRGSACLGDPLAALAWLAGTAARFGDPLRAGDVVLSGALGPMVALPPGAAVHADVGALGSVSITCTAEGNA
jgi:2-keto-4-pentenoate hydratase